MNKQIETTNTCPTSVSELSPYSYYKLVEDFSITYPRPLAQKKSYMTLLNKRMAASKPSRYWCFTHNNYTAHDVQRYKDFEKLYLAIGFETSDSGTPHIQGYIHFKRNYRLSQLHKLVPHAHWEPAVASDAMNYSMKEEYYIEDNRQKGKRTDLDTVRTQVQEGQPMSKIVKEATSYQAIRYAEKLKQYNPTRRNWETKVTYIHGPSGIGKTRMAWELLGPDTYVKPPGKFWCGYEGQENIILDDFRSHEMSFSELLRVLDRYPHIVEVKGGHQNLLAKNIVITSIHPPESLYTSISEDPNQLLRRIHFPIHLDQKHRGPDPCPIPANARAPPFHALTDPADPAIADVAIPANGQGSAAAPASLLNSTPSSSTPKQSL